ncbi:MAG TPA: multifunctional oxoglutarate decarboxylase/oxoglutarate dehydrogenase thiamine pyrophosphate-binding subunit/dihydrolipoyllysine-residue succinyltransferase subunit [Candidatus Acidoferrales bacterium]|nr:multifunctional oxoglutarate decarboxylase/oxoglutarate dehydrogenase thiamine pyrophosphate-binding subunit/dihydrolipoyllysine-residue succinyltransferase subunit [Candidatus Acidoferrales bacterium]
MLETTVKVTLPEMGESVTEGSIVEWRVKPGQWIDEGATLVDVTTDKVDVEVPAPVSGVVTQLFAADGATIPVGAALAEIDPSAAKPEGGGAAAPAVSTAAAAPPAPAPMAAAAPAAAPATANGTSAGVATHRAHRLAEQRGIPLSSVRGSGPDGLILFQDVVTAASSPDAKVGARNGSATLGQPASPVGLPPLSAGAKVTPLKGPAAALVGAMEQSLSIPTATSFRTIAVTALDKRRAELNGALKAAGRSEKISFTHLIAYALARAAHDYPSIVTTFRRENGTPSKVEAGVHLGLAVDTQRKDGSRFLVVPVIKDADGVDFKTFRERYEDLVAKARDNKLTADDLTGGTITLTNPGGIGTVASVPRLTVGQATIIAAGAIGYPPGLQHADEAALRQLGVEKVMTLTSTYDHRVIQGAQSGEYLRRVDDLLGGSDGFYEAVFASFGLRAGAAALAAPPARSAAVAAASSTASAQRPAGGAYTDEILRAVGAGMALVSSYRRHGHLAAMLDPLGTPPIGDPSLDPQTYGLTPALMEAVPASALVTTKISSGTLADVYPKLRETYASTIAYEVEHIANIEQRKWLREYIESGAHKISLTPERARNVLWRLTKVETMERYLRKAYIGHKTFSIEGLDVMIPMLEEIMTEWAEADVGTVVLGMAHRGRLSTIAHVVNRPYEEILAEFEAADVRGEGNVDDGADVTGDVKYHHGQDGIYQTLDGKTINVSLANNPSHLEAVDGVVEGRARALQTGHETPVATLDSNRAAPILIHGDAAFSAQGVVAEVLNLQALRGYATGGTIHLIANNQIGFTTDPLDARSTRYASDLAKGFDVPIVHVNADDVDACMAAVHLALDFRERFGHDVIIDLVGYRRFGHNETDEPAYTQPEMYERIKAHPTVRELYAQKLISQGTITQEQVAELGAKAAARITEAHQNVKGGRWQPVAQTPQHRVQVARANRTDTKVPRSNLIRWNEELVAVPGTFTVHPKLARQLEKRKNAFESDGELDWGLAESLAFASLLSEGTPIRLTGQDTERGTFSHRHLVLHDPRTGAEYMPMQHLSDAHASFELHNSPLSEYACLAFEYGYAVEWPSALVLWEAQFGDFNNGAQIIIDQFIAAGRAKWGETSRLTMLLPHGYEGAGPEHSSARLERFLQLSAEGNVTVANCSTAAQYFHLLRLQAQQPNPKPLVIFTPKSLLRMRAAGGTLSDLVNGAFQPVIDDPRFADRRGEVERIILCSGKIYYDLISNPAYQNLHKTAIVRVELLSPLPKEQLVGLFAVYPNLRRVVWVQEEPKNMGARAHVRRRLIEWLPSSITDVEYIGRPYRASPSEGYGGAHTVEQERIVKEALTE